MTLAIGQLGRHAGWLAVLTLAHSALAAEPLPAQSFPPAPLRDPHHAIQFNRAGRPNLCARATRVVIGTAVGRESRGVLNRRVFGRKVMIVTRWTFEVERAVLAGPDDGLVLSLDSLGGELGDVGSIVEGEPRFVMGSRMLLFMADVSPVPPDDGEGEAVWAPLIAWYALPRTKDLPRLPDSRDLAAVLGATCAASPEGIYFEEPVRRIVVPSEVVSRNAGSAFEQMLLPSGERRSP